MSSNRDKQTSFRYGISRAELLKIQKEIDDMKKQSTERLRNQRQEEKAVYLKEQDYKIGFKIHNVEMDADFGKKEMPFTRRTEPTFHQDLLENIDSQKKQVFQSVPAYNPLNKEAIIRSPGPTNKRPYNKEQTVTTSEMAKPHVQSIGVVPARSTQCIGSLNVIMQGIPLRGEELTIDAVQKANERSVEETRPHTADTVPEPPRNPKVTGPSKEAQPLGPDLAPHQKPAIVGSVGTTMKLTLSERSKPTSTLPTAPVNKRKSGESKNSYHRRSRITKSSKTYPSSASVNLDDYDLESEFMYDSDDSDFDVSRGGRHHRELISSERKNTARARSTVSVGSHKSVSELLAEAEEIASPDSIPLYKKAQRKADKDRRISKHRKATEKEEEEKAPVERTVDDIIASLKAAREGGRPKKSEADLKIQQIMKRVMTRSKDVLGEEVDTRPDEEEHDSHGEEEQEETGVNTGDAMNVDNIIPEIQVTEQHSMSVELLGLGQESYEQLPSLLPSRAESALSITPRLTEENIPAGMIEDTKDDNGKLEKQQPLHQKPSVVFKEDAIRKEEDEDEEERPINVEDALALLDLPTDVAFEDIIHVKGESQSLIERQDISSISKTDLRPTVQNSSMSFLSAWAPQETPKYPAHNQSMSRMDSCKPPRQSIHHFCTNLPLLHLPGHLQGVSRMYHTPSKYGITSKWAEQTPEYEFSESRNLSRMSMRSEGKEGVEEQEWRMQQENLREEVMSAAARRILDEAENEQTDTAEDAYHTWERRAHDLFDEEELMVDGKKMELLQDASR
ncbi:uncharacterized protein LOC117112456 [Anneissia japonica]|uniref:uncharacterized protein LOC117112456 n=1 Tax=Anneissia japonica TaxID=1529436 RepID=UPI00142561E5|nr:uncharacterized protein LOC117112456 [Anneissia japonica]